MTNTGKSKMTTPSAYLVCSGNATDPRIDVAIHPITLEEQKQEAVKIARKLIKAGYFRFTLHQNVDNPLRSYLALEITEQEPACEWKQR